MEMAILYGAITLHHDYIRSTDFIKTLGKDLMFPPISTSDFGLGDYNNYFYDGNLMYHYSWDNMILSYASTMGAAVFENPNFNLYILKMEHVLRNIDFVNAIIHIQSVESSESADLFWENKMHRYFDKSEEIKTEHLFETDEWNFGYGKRSMKGYLNETAEDTWHTLNNHSYPAHFSEEFTQLFFERIEILTQIYGSNEIPRTLFETDAILKTHELRSMISYLLFKKIITVVEMKNTLEAIQIIRRDLLDFRSLYQ